MKDNNEVETVLLPALRQYQHNDCSGLLAGYDLEETQRIVATKDAEIARLAQEADRYRNERDAWIGRATELQGGDDELRAQLADKDAEIARLKEDLRLVMLARDTFDKRLTEWQQIADTEAESRIAERAAQQQSVVPSDAEGSAAQKSFWAGFEAAHMSGSTNIREAWNHYKATDEFALLNADRSAQGDKE